MESYVVEEEEMEGKGIDGKGKKNGGHIEERIKGKIKGRK